MSRKTTRKFLDLLEEGAVTPADLCEQLLNWMDESDVTAFALVHGYLEDAEADAEAEAEADTHPAPHVKGGRGFFDDIWLKS